MIHYQSIRRAENVLPLDFSLAVVLCECGGSSLSPSPTNERLMQEETLVSDNFICHKLTLSCLRTRYFVSEIVDRTKHEAGVQKQLRLLFV